MQIVFTDGLGNQMFQYAFFLAMKHRGGNPLINTGIINRNIIHNGFELCDVFNIDKDKLHFTMQSNLAGGITIFINRYLKLLYYQQDNGYWQDIRYFEEVQDEVRNAFIFRSIDENNIDLGNEMECRDSVSIHIRRGDYLKFPQLQICTPSYYKRAISIINQKVKNPLYYVFSDDLEWSNHLMKEMNVNYKMVCNNRGRDSYKDMFLMEHCHHNIIANSSFSWWGAWLGKFSDKIVVCPNEWIKGSRKDPSLNTWLKT